MTAGMWLMVALNFSWKERGVEAPLLRFPLARLLLTDLDVTQEKVRGRCLQAPDAARHRCHLFGLGKKGPL
jgi:hypothetical protein